jgi:hypothetical protein
VLAAASPLSQERMHLNLFPVGFTFKPIYLISSVPIQLTLHLILYLHSDVPIPILKTLEMPVLLYKVFLII